jgi:hypothetical protein
MKKLKLYDEKMYQIIFDTINILSKAGIDPEVEKGLGYIKINKIDYSIQFDLEEGIVLIPDNQKELRRFKKRQKKLIYLKLGLNKLQK